MKITLKPLGDIASETLEELKKRLNNVFGCPVEIKPGASQVANSYNPERKQYLSSGLVNLLNALTKEKDERVVGITDVDLYTPGLNFIFGQADIISGTAIVSLCRLRQEYYGSPPDKALFLERATKEIVHELGHTFGLQHCPNLKCVMHFSNSLADTDWKEVSFCNKCRPKLGI
jgi:archaemetzincin